MANQFRTLAAAAVAAMWLASSAWAQPPQPMPGAGMAGHGGDSSAMAEMRVIHELFMSHDRVTRTVTKLPDGIRTVTESDDPRVAALLKGHVERTGKLVDAGTDPNLPMESPALHAIFKGYDKVHTTLETTATGIVVVQTSTDPDTVVALQQHATEVTKFVDEGMAAMHEAMMKAGARQSGASDQATPAPR